MRISDWSSDVCSSDLRRPFAAVGDVICVGVVGVGHVSSCADRCNQGAAWVPPASTGSSWAVAISLLKKVYDRVSVVTSLGSAGSTMKRPGITRSSPACSNCWVKQKPSVLLQNADPDDGAIDGTAWPTIALSDRFAAWKVASASSPGCTFISNVSEI